jgi:RND family efflux transporter MFP subunit
MGNRVAAKILPALIIVAAALAAWAMIQSRTELPRQEKSVPLPLVNVIGVNKGPVSVNIYSHGTVQPKRTIDLVSEVSGRVIRISPDFVLGGMIEAGELLVEIDPIDYEVAVSDARASVASAELLLAEVKVLEKRAAITEANARVAAAKEQLRRAESDLANTRIKAPFNAVVDRKLIDFGQYVTAGSTLARLLGTDTVEVRLPLLAKDAGLVNGVGEKPIPVILSGDLGTRTQQWPAELVRMENRVDEQTRVLYLVAELAQPYSRDRYPEPLRIGLFVDADIRGAVLPNAVRLPRTVLHDSEFVFVVSDGVLVKRAVTLLRREGDEVIIGDGLVNGDRVVTTRLELMMDGLAVAVAGS